MSPSPAIAPPATFQPRKRLGMLIGSMNLRAGFMRFVAIENGLIFLFLVWMSIDSQSPLGVLGAVVNDTGLPRESIIGVFGILFLIDVSQTMRRIPPTYGSLTSLGSQLALFLVTLFYVLKGALSPVALYGTGGVFFLSLIGMIVVIQSYQAEKPRFDAKRLMYPALSLCMGGLALALAWPGSATLEFIHGQYDGIIALALIGLLAWGAGQLKQNHLRPDQVAVRAGGMFFVAFFSIVRFVEDPSASLLGMAMHVMVWILAMFYAFIQAQEYPTPQALKDIVG